MKINTIYVVGALHGNEVFALKVLAQLELYNNQAIRIRVGNPEAIAKRKSYIESDLNRSFGAFTGKTQEAKLAKVLCEDIERFAPDLIIDVHSAVAKIGCVGIAASDAPELTIVAAKLGMPRMAIMPPYIHDVSLIGQFTDKALSLDFGKGYRSDVLAKKVASAIHALVGEDVQPTQQMIPVFRVERTILPHEATPEELVNYQFHKGLKGYPFLASATGYKDYRGFLAQHQ